MRKQLRTFYTPTELKRVYAHPYDHTRWDDHRTRVALTIRLARWYADSYRVRSIADLACGDAVIIRALGASDRLCVTDDLLLGKPIEQSILELDPVDMFICTETIEHVQDPDTLLGEIRSRAKILILSTPDGEWNDSNPEHYWGWDVDEMEKMLHDSGWKPDRLMIYDTQLVYRFMIWGCL